MSHVVIAEYLYLLAQFLSNCNPPKAVPGRNHIFLPFQSMLQARFLN